MRGPVAVVVAILAAVLAIAGISVQSRHGESRDAGVGTGSVGQEREPQQPAGRLSPIRTSRSAGVADPGRSVSFGVRTESSGCQLRGRSRNLPDPRCTPGAYFSNAGTSMVCVRGYSAKVRHVTAAIKRRVYDSYGIHHHARGQYEVDHLVPLEGGGSNAIDNLFPEPAGPRPGFHEKDRVEDELHRRICRGGLDQRTAQRRIASDWTAYWREWF